MFRLREIERNDIPTINAWRNDKNLIDQLGSTFRYINQDVDDEWFSNYMRNRNTTVRCAILKENNIIGLVSLTGIDSLAQTADFHIMIGDRQNQEKGAGTFATKEILKHAFNNLNINRVQLTVLTDNIRARNMYQKIGFKEEGRLRQVYYKNGKHVDAYIYSILKQEFNKSLKE